MSYTQNVKICMFSNPSSNVNLALKKTSLINLDSKQLTARVNAYKAEIHIIHALISMAKRGLGEKMKKREWDQDHQQ